MFRQTHLYRFSVMLSEIQQETRAANQSGVVFAPGRAPLKPDHATIRRMAEELPMQFNACYLVMLAWLSRMYEVRGWAADTRRRQAIEMLVTWPLMSMAIRPFLELASVLPIDRQMLFRTEPAGLPMLPTQARQLHQLYESSERTEAVNEQMDYLALRVLTRVADWAKSRHEAVSKLSLAPEIKTLLLTRLRLLIDLREFEVQFPFRVDGGYSNRAPDIMYRGPVDKEESRFEEDPSTLKALFKDTLLLRLRFSGRGLVQLATDPDPPLDEAGCTGTHMLHASDGDRRLNRALVWQHTDPKSTILRTPRAELPPLGVNVREASLLVTDGTATANYAPIAEMNSSGAVQTSGVQRMPVINGVLPLLTRRIDQLLAPGREVRVELRSKGNDKPFLNGANHLVWKDGEPIDPFVFAVSVDAAAGGAGSGSQLVYQREIFNEDLNLLEMSPLQRQLTSRAPVGFDERLGEIPPWGMQGLSAEEGKMLSEPEFAQAYLRRRSEVLIAELSKEIEPNTDNSRDKIDVLISLAERTRLVTLPKGTTVGWLGILLHYGHTLSGTHESVETPDPLLDAIGAAIGLDLSVTRGVDRAEANGRWLTYYTKGIMDTDALANLVYGEVYIPLTAKLRETPQVVYSWTFHADLVDVLSRFACRFSAPFWDSFEISGDGMERKPAHGDGNVVERLLEQGEQHYRYQIIGMKGIDELIARFTLTEEANEVRLEWATSTKSESPTAMVMALTAIARQAEAVTEALEAAFAPKKD
jgi:hypothetical protein